MNQKASLAFTAAAAALCLAWPARAQQSSEGIALPGTASIPDAQALPSPSAVKLGGLLGDRFLASEKARLLKVDEDELLGGYRKRPGSHPWIGEHVGKWLHAASLTWMNTRDPELRAKLDRVAKGLMATQEDDGYLGTYEPGKRFGLYPGADWDVWSHKYCLIGLLSYYQATGDKDALATCRRAGDLLMDVFAPAKKSILEAGTHMGMAATSVLEPMVLLYRATHQPRYLAFAEYIVAQWELPNGPHILSALKEFRSVRRTANGKAYEMCSNLVGLCELYRVTGDRRYLETALTAWEDVVAHRLYITGSGSAGEVWQDDYVLPNGEGAHICETCVTVTWEQLNTELLRLTGESRFADQIERTVYNHLLGAQEPAGARWSYYTPLEGRKPYDASTNCCHSSGPRGVALLPSLVYALSADGVAVNLYTPARATLSLARGGSVDLDQQTGYPFDGKVTLKLTPHGAREFALRLRIPAWTAKASVIVNGKAVPGLAVHPGDYAILRRAWKAGDQVVLQLDMAPRWVPGDHGNQGRAAAMAGPLVLAADEAANPDVKPIGRVNLAAEPGKPPIRMVKDAAGQPEFETKAQARAGAAGPAPLRLVPYFRAGGTGARFQVWLRLPGTQQAAASLFQLGKESRSRQGNQPGEMADGDAATYCVTFDGTEQDEDWYAVELDEPATINRVVFAHGHCFHDGGWFDTSAGKPRIQGRKAKGGPWEDLAVLDAYPPTTAAALPNLPDGKEFAVRLAAPVSVYGIRIVGRPSCGDNPAQAFSSCAELEGWLEK